MAQPNSTFDEISDFVRHFETSRDLTISPSPNTTTQQCIDTIIEYTSTNTYISLQTRFIYAIVRILLNPAARLASGQALREPRPQQVECIRRIVYQCGDTILLAATGFGKSIVLQAVSIILPTKVTLQIIPLSRLGQEQKDVIAKYPGAKPLLIDQDLHKTDTLWDRIRSGHFTHILLGPEQALHHRFLKLLRAPEFAARIAFVAIDELHTVHQWRDFREKFSDLYQLRRTLPLSVPWFGCTATLTEESEAYVRQHAGFHAEGESTNSLKIIRAPIDRPNISIIFTAIPPKESRNFERLEFLLIPTAAATIPKTIVYIDNKDLIGKARKHLIRALVRRGIRSRADAPLTVQIYHSHVRPADQERLYKQFVTPDSQCRIMISTVALGMGMDIPDVIRVVQYGEVATQDVADLWQRFGRAVRGGGDGMAYFFAPHWYYDKLGYTSIQPPSRNTQSDAGRSLMYASESSFMTDGIFDILQSQPLSQAKPVSSVARTNFGIFGTVHPKKWTEASIKSRAKLVEKHPEMYAVANAKCFREAILNVLQSGIDHTTGTHIPTMCCNGCNYLLGRMELPPEKTKKELGAPTPTSKAAIFLVHLQDFFAERIKSYPRLTRDVDFQLPYTVLFPAEMSWQVARTMVKVQSLDSIRTLDDLVARIPLLQDWEYLDTYGPDLFAECIRVLLVIKGTIETNKRKNECVKDTVYSGDNATQPTSLPLPHTLATPAPAPGPRPAKRRATTSQRKRGR